MEQAEVSKALRFVKWLLCIVVALALLLAAYMWWVVARFDTATLPARHGQVDAELFARDGAQRPLIVGLGGVGTQVARRAHAFGMRAVAVDPGETEKPAFVFGLHKPDKLKDLLWQAINQ